MHTHSLSLNWCSGLYRTIMLDLRVLAYVSLLLIDLYPFIWIGLELRAFKLWITGSEAIKHDLSFAASTVQRTLT